MSSISDCDIASEVGQARRPGLHDSLDTGETFLWMFEEFRAKRAIP